MTLFRPGEGASFPGSAGDLPMRIERAAQGPDGSWTIETGAVRYFLDAKGTVIAGAQRLRQSAVGSEPLASARKAAYWRPSLPLTGLRLRASSSSHVLLASEFLTVGVHGDGLLMLVPHKMLFLRTKCLVGGAQSAWEEGGHLLARDDEGGFCVRPDGEVRVVSSTRGLSEAIRRPGAEVRWQVAVGQRLGLSVFPHRLPPRSERSVSDPEYVEGEPSPVQSQSAIARLSAEISAADWPRVLRAWRIAGVIGVRLDGLETLPWLDAYARVRQAREVFPRGMVLLTASPDAILWPLLGAYATAWVGEG